MSTEMKPTKHFTLTRFFGGTERGVCLQLTDRERAVNPPYFSLTKSDALELAAALVQFANDTLPGDDTPAPASPTKPRRMTFNNVVQGDLVTLSYRGHGVECKFLGFTDNSEKYSEKPRFAKALHLKDWAQCKTWGQLEQKQADDHEEYGYHFHAIFEEEDGSTFGAYLFKGAWCVGSSADRASLS